MLPVYISSVGTFGRGRTVVEQVGHNFIDFFHIIRPNCVHAVETF